MRYLYRLVIAIIISFSGLISAQTTYFVDASRTDNTGDGLSWTNAKKDIQAAVNSAVNNDAIIIKYGTYYLDSAINITQDITFISDDGTCFGPADASPDSSQCIIDGKDSTRLFHVARNSTDSILFSGIKFQNGCANFESEQIGKGGVFLVTDSAHVSFESCWFDSNTGATDTSGTGGVMYIFENYADIFFNKCLLSNNIGTTGASGGAGALYICIFGGSVVIQNSIFEGNIGNTYNCASNGACVLSINNNASGRVFNNKFINNYSSTADFDNNTGYAQAGALTVYGDGINISGNYFYGNVASGGTAGIGQGGALDVLGDGTVVENNIFYKNTAVLGSSNGYGGAILVSGGTGLALVNNTLISNNSGVDPVNSYGDGIYISDGSGLIIKNNIISFNDDGTGDDRAIVTFTAGFVDSSNCIYGTNGNSGMTSYDQVYGDPFIVDTAARDFRLGSASSCIDSGNANTAGLSSTDYAGNPRVVNSIVDIGALESYFPVIELDSLRYSNDSVYVYGNVTDDHGYMIFYRGFTYNTTGDPDVHTDNFVNKGGGTGSINGVITPVPDGTIYYVRGTAKNGYEEGYSDELFVWTKPLPTTTSGYSTDTSYSLTLTWNANSIADSYLVDVSTDSLFSSYLDSLQGYSVTDTFVTVTDLSYGTTLYYRVRCSNSGGYSDYSDTGFGQTYPGVPGTTVLDSTSDTTAAIKWHSAAGADYYEVYVREADYDQSYQVSGFYPASISDTTIKITGLHPGYSVEVIVHSYNDAGTGGSNDPFYCGTLPSTPDSIKIFDLNSNTAVLTWRRPAGLFNDYYLEIDTTLDFNSLSFSGIYCIDTFKVVNPLTSGQTYYARVKSIGSYGSSTYSNTVRFVMLPGPSQPLYPADGSMIIPTDTTLYWQPQTGAVQYSVMLSDSNAFTNAVIDTIVTGTSLDFSGLSRITKYYWRVKCYTESGPGDWSPVSQFTTIVPLTQAPALDSMLTNAVNTDTTVTFRWNSAQYADHYVIQISEVDSFTTVLYSDSTVTDSVFTVLGMQDGRRYYWRIQGVNAAGYGSWSDTGKIITYMFAPDSLNAAAGYDSVIVKWQDISSSAEGFVLFRSIADSAFTILDTLTAGTDLYIDNAVVQGTRYHYRILAFNQFTQSDTTDPVEVITLVGIDDPLDGIPKEYVLHQNYPNPFNPTTTIRYGLPFVSDVKLHIYNILGERMSVLLDRTESAGYHEIEWNAVRFASGVYLLVIQANSVDRKKEFKKVIKLLLLK